MNHRRKLAWLAAAAALQLAACASSRSVSDGPTYVDPAEDPELKAALRDLALSKAEQSGRRAAGDCAEVCRISAMVCEASAHLCNLARRREQAEPYARYCVSAREDCRGAQEQCDDCK